MTLQDVAGSSSNGSRTEVRCSLCVFSKTVPPDRVTAIIGIQPSRTRRIGEAVRRGQANGPTVQRHQWIWEVPDRVPSELDAQLDALDAALTPLASSISSLGADADVVVDLVVEHYGSSLSLGWTMASRHVSMVAQFGATLSVDEYNYTE
jgi:hypothetical protein